MLFNRFPYTEAHELNLDFLLKKSKELGADVRELETRLTESTGDLSERLSIVEDWINNYNDSFMKSEIQKYIATMIFVEISDAGYIVYYIPDSWDEITFQTTGVDVVIPGYDYGHLVLDY